MARCRAQANYNALEFVNIADLSRRMDATGRYWYGHKTAPRRRRGVRWWARRVRVRDRYPLRVCMDVEAWGTATRAKWRGQSAEALSKTWCCGRSRM
jgi:hypothetical protein